MRKTSGWCKASLQETIVGLEKGNVNAVDLVTECQNQIEQTRIYNMFIHDTFKTALDQAHESDKRRDSGKSKGPLDGIPIALKDNYCTKDVPTTAASKMLQSKYFIII